MYRERGGGNILVAASAALIFISTYSGYKKFYALSLTREPAAIFFMAFLLILAFFLGYVGIKESLFSKIPALSLLDDRLLYRGQTSRRPTEILYSEIKGTRIREEKVKGTLRKYVDVYRNSDRVFHIYTNDLSLSAKDIIDHLDKRWMVT